jgi:hypothetical protein
MSRRRKTIPVGQAVETETARPVVATKLAFHPDGWATYTDDNVPGGVRVRLEPTPAGRLVIVALYVERDRVDARWLRRLPLGRIEAWANQPENAKHVTGAASGQLRFSGEAHGGRVDATVTPATIQAKAAVPQATPDVKAYAEVAEGRGSAFDATVHTVELTDAATVSDRLTVRRGSGASGALTVVPALPPTARQRVKDDSFYQRIAEIYGQVAVASKRPAKDLAETWKVPITTVHRWVREARRRGHLLPAEQGRRG